jgi:hypothetical protein
MRFDTIDTLERMKVSLLSTTHGVTMRTLILLLAAFVLFLPGCPRDPSKKGTGAATDHSVHEKDWPAGYRGWSKINDTTIVRTDEEVAREIYAKTTAGLGQGTVLVKEDYALVSGQKGALQMIAVMQRGTGSEHNGWQFFAFNPKTKKKDADGASGCVGCHSLRASNDYLYTAKDKL